MHWCIARKNKTSNANMFTCFDGRNLNVMWLLVSLAMSSIGESRKCISAIKQGDGSGETVDLCPMAVAVMNSGFVKVQHVVDVPHRLVHWLRDTLILCLLDPRLRGIAGHAIVFHCLLCSGFSVTMACFS